MATALACIELPAYARDSLTDRVLECVSEALVVVDAGSLKLPVVLANAAARRLLGATLRADSLHEHSLYASLGPDSGPPLAALLAELTRGGAPVCGLLVWRTRSGDCVCETTGQLLAGAAGERLVLLRLAPDRPPVALQQLEIARRERRRLGCDLHDGLGQELTGVALMLRGLARQLETDAPQLLGATNEIVALVNRAIAGARTLASGLLTVTNEPGGLLAALRGLAERGRALYDLDVQFRREVTLPLGLDESAANHLYRIAQEALTNAARHARATRVEILLRVESGRFLLEIADDGIGLASATASTTGLGLGILRERAMQLGAHLEFVENSPAGTRVRVTGIAQWRDGEPRTNAGG